MNREDFAKSINYDNIARDIRTSFDQIMALYNLIGVRGDLDICAEKESEEQLTFILLADNIEEAAGLYDVLKDRNINIYGHTYKPELRQTKNTISVVLSEDTPEKG